MELLMRRAGIKGVTGRPKLRRSKPDLISTDLVDRQFARSGPNQLWVTDITEHHTRVGKLHRAVVLDTYSRRVVVWSIDSTQTAALVSVRWHGMHLPAGMDGGPHQPIRPGRTWSPTWRVDQPAAIQWYHPHPHGQTEHHVYRGLAGLFIVDDKPESALALPAEYGLDDVPVIVQDKRFAAMPVAPGYPVGPAPNRATAPGTASASPPPPLPPSRPADRRRDRAGCCVASR